MLPQLRRLERKYDRELVVVGVHSAKFAAEKSTEAIRHAVARHDVGHPVANDRDFRLWQEYAVRAWPTLIFIDPRGRVIARHEGEVPFEALDRAIGQLVAEFEARGLLDRRPLSFALAGLGAEGGPLRFPGKVLADPASGRLFIADTGHHRLVVAGLDGQVERAIGSGQPGLQDGPAEAARFNHPQGLALQGHGLFVADTDNHALRRVDLATGATSTIAGTGEQAQQFHAGGPARQVALNSPWDLVFHLGQLWVAMAGFHQVWALDLDHGLLRPAIGSGREGLQDGLLEAAELAQPSGLANDGQWLFVACSEASAIRCVDVAAERVGTLVGLGLFEFGDQDGVGQQVRLQHPLGLAAAQGVLYLADTYNHKLKRLDRATAEVRTLFGSGVPGYRDGPALQAQFSEPGGLTLAGHRLYVADTNNHLVRVADLASETVQTLELRGLGPPSAGA
ncbi:MAG: alkyl hydroperoxide reductase [Chloroflexi bacterium]|nr:alkyl hydroperoxide reductase [Chloroflexota bacterium]